MRLLPCVYHRNMFIIDFFSFRKESLVTYKSASTSGFLLPLLLDGGVAALAASMRSTRDSRAEIAS